VQRHLQRGEAGVTAGARGGRGEERNEDKRKRNEP
jgi:hypothetical protein